MIIKYVEMPITREQKKAFNAQGFMVVDARFAPEELLDGGAGAPEEDFSAPTERRRSRRERG